MLQALMQHGIELQGTHAFAMQAAPHSAVLTHLTCVSGTVPLAMVSY